MAQYRVTWTIELDEDSPAEAAKVALRIHRDPDSEATSFEVEELATGKRWDIDLLPEEE